ncbi:MAG: YciI family protein [Alphaproteobacteria bacterium]
MLYTLLIYQAEEVFDTFTEADREAMLSGHRTLQQTAKAGGAFVLANELMRSDAATTVRLRADQTTIVDGPFAETKEQLAGLYVVDCENLDGAIDLAKQIPNVRTGSIEIRPIAYFEGPPAG